MFTLLIIWLFAQIHSQCIFKRKIFNETSSFQKEKISRVQKDLGVSFQQKSDIKVLYDMYAIA